MTRFFQSLLPLAATAALATVVTGCDRPKSPEAVRAALSETGGLRVTISAGEVSGTDARVEMDEYQLANFSEAIGKRLSTLDQPDFLIERNGSTLIVTIAGPSEDEMDEIRSILTPTVLELREVHPETFSRARAVFEGEDIVAGYKAYLHHGTNRDGESFTEHLLINSRASVRGGDIEDAWAQPQGNDNQVGVKLTAEGGEKMIALTRPMNPGHSRIAILLDGEVLSAPVVQTVPLGRNFVIQGQNSFEEAEKLARQLLTPLDFPFTLKSIEAVAASDS